MKRLYVCGNGFDLHHGMKTRYADYRDYLKKNNPDYLTSFEEDACWDDKDKAWSCLEDNMNLDLTWKLEDLVPENYPSFADDSDSKWSDFEIAVDNELSYIKSFSGNHFGNWLRTINYDNIQRSNKFPLRATDFFVNFNYTHTLEKIYGIPADNILYIHGSINEMMDAAKDTKGAISDECVLNCIQFGNTEISRQLIHEELEKQYGKDEMYGASLRAVVLTYIDIVNSLSKDIKKNYSRLESFIEENKPDEVIVAGHSLGRMDWGYFEDILIPKLHNARWKIMQHPKAPADEKERIKRLREVTSGDIIGW